MTDTYSALREYRKRIAAMLDDPECTEDLFSLGVALLDFAVLRVDRNERNWRFYAELAWGARASDWRIRGVLKSDIRRYDALKDAESKDPVARCGSPMIRRQGPCGQSGTLRALLTDPITGRKQWISACSRHRDWFNERVRSNRLAVQVHSEENPGAIRPFANAGGVLARHIPEIDWESTWRKIDKDWTPPPEGEPEVVPVAPKLRLVLGGAS